MAGLFFSSGSAPSRLHRCRGRLISAHHRWFGHVLRKLGDFRHAVGLLLFFLLREIGDLVLSLHMNSVGCDVRAMPKRRCRKK